MQADGRFTLDVPAAVARPGTGWTLTLTRDGAAPVTTTGTFAPSRDALVGDDPLVPSYDGSTPAGLGGGLTDSTRSFINGPAELTVDVIGADGVTRSQALAVPEHGFWQAQFAPSGVSAVLVGARFPDGSVTARTPQLVATRGISTELVLDQPPAPAPGGPVVRGRLTASADWAELGVDPAGRQVNLVYNVSGKSGNVTTTMNPDGTFSAQLPELGGPYSVHATMPAAFPLATQYSSAARSR